MKRQKREKMIFLPFFFKIKKVKMVEFRCSFLGLHQLKNFFMQQFGTLQYQRIFYLQFMVTKFHFELPKFFMP